MRSSKLPVIAVLTGLVCFALACEDDSTTAGIDPVGFDAGLAEPSVPDGASSHRNDGGDDGGGSEAGGPNALSPVTCAAPIRIDSLRGVNGSSTISAAHSGDRWLVLWYQIGAVSQDSKEHLKGRFFDGTTLGAEQDIASDQAYEPPLPIAVDGTGRGFTQFVEPTAQQVAIDFATGGFTKTPFSPGAAGSDTPVAIAPIPAGGALSVYRTGAGVAADRWDVGEQKWKPTDLTGPAVLSDLRAVTNGAGKGAATWIVSDGGSGYNLTVATWDGAHWTSKTKNFPLDSGLSVGFFRPAVQANGDVQVIWQVGSRYLKGSVYHPSAAAGAEWDSPTTFRDAGESGSLSEPLLLVDNADRFSVGWLEASKAWVRKGSGGTLADPVDLGSATSFALALDPFANPTALTFDLADRIAIRRSPASGNEWSPRVPTGVGISNGVQLGRQAAVVFDAAGHPTIITQNDATGAGIGLGLVYAACR